MKKSMIIAVIVVYIASIVAVNFFGLSIKQFEGKIYVNAIECNVVLQREVDTTVTVNKNVPNDDRTWYIFSFQGNGYSENDYDTNPNVALIEYRAYPDNADNRRVKFIYDKAAAKGKFVFDEETATIYFLKKGSGISVTVEAADGSKIKQELYILAK